MKKSITLITVLFAVNLCIFSQTKQEDLKALFVLMNTEETISKTLDNILPVMMQQANSKLKEDDVNAKQKTEELMQYIIKATKELTMKLVNVEMVVIYDKYFSHEEIKDLISFYQTPTGKKTIDLAPQLTKELMDPMMNKYMPEFQQDIIKKTKEILE